MEQGATLFVVANVSAWDRIEVRKQVPPSELDAFLEEALGARGVALDGPVAIRIEGATSALRGHVVDGSKLVPGAGHAEHARTALTGSIAHAEFVGFFSLHSQGVFTHAGSHSHFHALVTHSSPPVSGHVDEVTLEPGAQLAFPKLQ